MAKTTIALIYDFDKTLCTTDMQEYDFIKNLGISNNEFWGGTAEYTDKFEMDKILSYMYLMVKKCREKNIPLTEEYLNKCGQNVVLYRGVQTWFERINEIGNSLNANVEHYIVSSGITEIIEGTPIAKYFKKIYGCRFLYDDVTKEAIWPANAINFTLKTQYIFRISKGVLDVRDDDNLHKHGARRIPYRNMIYIGDGLTDIPCMKLLREKGGRSIALYPSGKKQKVLQLLKDNRINYACVADYSINSTLEKIVKQMLESMVSIDILEAKEEHQLAQLQKMLETEVEVLS